MIVSIAEFWQIMAQTWNRHKKNVSYFMLTINLQLSVTDRYN